MRGRLRRRGFLRKRDWKRPAQRFTDDQWRATSLQRLLVKLLRDPWPECISARPPKTSWERRKSLSTTSSSWPKTKKDFMIYQLDGGNVANLLWRCRDTTTSRTTFVFWSFLTFPDTDACTRNRRVHIGTRRVHPSECRPRIDRTLRCAHQSPPRQFVSHRECRRWHNDAFCPFWFLRMSFYRRLRQLLRKPKANCFNQFWKNHGKNEKSKCAVGRMS